MKASVEPTKQPTSSLPLLSENEKEKLEKVFQVLFLTNHLFWFSLPETNIWLYMVLRKPLDTSYASKEETENFC